MKKIAIFASGSGSNAENIILFFAKNPEIRVSSVFCNIPDAYVLERAKKYHIPSYIFNKEELRDPEGVLKTLKDTGIDFIVLAGFLWKIPSGIITEFDRKIVNIHPALLPKYGGKGMYGMNVHCAVIASGEKESGITIHYINERYDEGDIVFQAKCPVSPGDTPEMLAEKIHALEHAHFPRVVEDIIKKR